MTTNPKPWSLTARWILPVDQPPIANGIIQIENDIITHIGPPGTTTADVNLGDTIVLPGLVNAHIHLDLSGFHHPIPYEGNFTQWLRSVINHRITNPIPVADQINRGIAECIASGVTLLGDISFAGQSWHLLSGSSLRAVVFNESLGLSAERAKNSFQSILNWLDGLKDCSNITPGVSPHAPYSTRRELYQQLADLASSRQLPLMTHLAETREEIRFLESKDGVFRQFLEGVNAWDPEGLVDHVEEVVSICQKVPHLLLAHGTNLNPACLKGWHGTVVYCPRTHAHFGQTPHPFRELLLQGTRVALGTDSRASNPDLSILEEMRYLHSHYPDLSSPSLLRMATIHGAEALGLEKVTGSLSVGKSADLIVVPIDQDGEDPFEILLKSGKGVEKVLFRGTWIKGGL